MNIFFASVIVFSTFFSAISPTDISGLTIDCKPHYLDNYYLPAWVTNDTWYREMPQYTAGKAVWYAPNLMNSTALMRGMNLDGFKGGVATNSVDMMGKVVWLKRQNLSWEGPFLVVDVSQRNHAYHHAVNVKTIVEVDFETAIEWGITSYNQKAQKGYTINRWYEGNVEMWVGLEPPQELNENPTIYSEWYKEHAEFCDGQPNRRWKTQDWMIMNYDDYNEQTHIHQKETTEEMSRAFAIEQLRQTPLFQIINRYPELPIFGSIIPTLKLASLSKETPQLEEEAIIQPEETTMEPEIITTHTLQSHETWTHLALYYYGHTTKPYWRLIYEANADLVGDDYRRIWGGMEIVIPALPADFNP